MIFNINGFELDIVDENGSLTTQMTAADLNKNPKHFQGLKDVNYIHDIGAHVGMVSIYLKKLYPKSRICCNEPIYVNFSNFHNNLVRNFHHKECEDFHLFNLGISGLEKEVMFGFPDHNTGAGCFIFGEKQNKTKCMSINSFLNKDVDLMKIDVEGMEYEIIDECTKWDKVRNLHIELHGLYPYEERLWSRLVDTYVEKVMSLPISGRVICMYPKNGEMKEASRYEK